MEAELQLAKQAAQQAGRLLLDIQRSALQVLSEEGRDIKLQADRDAEELILNALKSSPYNVLAEESGEHGVLEGDAPYWVVDPLDGTYNYSRKLPECCVSIALCQKEAPLLGVIYDFNRDEMFSGIVGEGAWLNDEPMRVSTITDPSNAIVCSGFPAHRDYSENALTNYIQRFKQFKKVRMLGSAALMVAYVACGRVDGYMEEDTMFWDIAAGVALVEAAGGVCRIEKSERKKWARKVWCSGTKEIFE
jgi:myo-inositol-1(or 4)-monophosphatase